jgi:hypothetical protein
MHEFAIPRGKIARPCAGLKLVSMALTLNVAQSAAA